MPKLAQEASEPNTTHVPTGVGGTLLDEIAREGARRMLAAALEAEVAAYIDAHTGQLHGDGHRLVVRNGHHGERQVATAAAAVTVRAPRVNDKRTDPDTGRRVRFSSAILPAWARKSPQVAEMAVPPTRAAADGECRCCIYTGCPRVISCPRWSSSSARRPACPPRPSPG